MSATAQSVVTTFNPDAPAVKKLLANLNSPTKMWWFYLGRLPTLIWWGARVKSVTPERGQTTLPYSWRTQNPFKSTYFAAQAGAAELSTGLLAIVAIHDRGRPVSMLITGMESEYTKKATSTITFTCEEGRRIQEAVDEALATGEGVTIQVTSRGVQKNGEEVSRFRFTWSFKVKKR